VAEAPWSEDGEGKKEREPDCGRDGDVAAQVGVTASGEERDGDKSEREQFRNAPMLRAMRLSNWRPRRSATTASSIRKTTQRSKRSNTRAGLSVNGSVAGTSTPAAMSGTAAPAKNSAATRRTIDAPPSPSMRRRKAVEVAVVGGRGCEEDR
jgi:hypothetical protein